MKRAGYYSSGEFAKMAQITLRTLRYYDQANVLKPSYVNESGARFYTDQDFAKLSQILLLKYLGFSLEDIKVMTITDTDDHYLLSSLKMQLHLIKDRIEQMHMVEKAIEQTTSAIETDGNIDWNHMLDIIHLTNMEKSMKLQYQNATNISARINLHTLYSQNQQGWFPWIFEQLSLTSHMNVLELGCGDGTLWTSNLALLPKEIHLTLSDISEGMIRDVRRNIGSNDPRFSFASFDCHSIPYEDATFDLVIANHLLFYCDDIATVCKEICRTLKPGGIFICSTYGSLHMKEVTDLVKEFDSHIVLSAKNLYDRFGLDHGEEELCPYFSEVTLRRYEDFLLVTSAEPLMEYILSCHGNQNQYLLDRYKDFRTFVHQKVKHGYHITKDAGIFYCKK